MGDLSRGQSWERLLQLVLLPLGNECFQAFDDRTRFYAKSLGHCSFIIYFHASMARNISNSQRSIETNII